MVPLADAEIDEFFERGFLVRPAVFAAAEIAEMRAAFDRLEETAGRLGSTRMHRGALWVLETVTAPDREAWVRIHRIVWCGAAEPALLRYGSDPRLLGMAAALLGSRRMSHIINQAHFKLPGDGVEFPWHQDSTHRRYGGSEWRDVNGRGSYVQTVIALDDVTEDNGPLRFLPGSGARGHLGILDPLPEPLREADAVPAVMEAGGVLLFGPYVLHSSRPNHSLSPRRSLVNGFASPGANSRVYPGCGVGRMRHAP